MINDNVAAMLTKLKGRVLLRICALCPALTREEMATIVKKIGRTNGDMKDGWAKTEVQNDLEIC
jgi:hypothetical protein